MSHDQFIPKTKYGTINHTRSILKLDDSIDVTWGHYELARTVIESMLQSNFCPREIRDHFGIAYGGFRRGITLNKNKLR